MSSELLFQIGQRFAVDDAFLFHFDRSFFFFDGLFLSASSDAFLNPNREENRIETIQTSSYFFFISSFSSAVNGLIASVHSAKLE